MYIKSENKTQKTKMNEVKGVNEPESKINEKNIFHC